MLEQRTIEKDVHVTGIGIHSGKKVTLKLSPAPVDHGITFNRVDLPDFPLIKAHAKNVGATENNTSIGSGRNVVYTVEHLLSVFYGLGIDNIRCELDGPEVPIMDGSAASFLFVLQEAGILSQNKSKKILVIKKKVEVRSGDKYASIEPSHHFEIHSEINFSHPVIGKQTNQFKFTCSNYIKEIARARTFGLLRDVDMLKKKGLVKGGSLDNAIVLDDFKVINPDGLRFNDEFNRHKILDAIGDFSLLGYPIAGKLNTIRSGHSLNNVLCREVLEQPDSFEIINIGTDKEEAYKGIFSLPFAVSPSNYL